MPNQGDSESSDDERADFDAGFDEDEAGQQELDNEPISMGDFVTLQVIQNRHRYLTAEGVLEDNCVASQEPDRFDDCIFQVCYKQSFSARREYRELLEREAAEEKEAGERGEAENNEREKNAKGGSESSGALAEGSSGVTPAANEAGGEEEEDDEEAQNAAELLLSAAARTRASRRRQAETEKVDNERLFKNTIGLSLKFGHTIMLRHVKSNKFLTVDRGEIAQNEPENLRVYLDDVGSPSSWLTLQAYNAIDKEGNVIMSMNAARLILSDGNGDGVMGIRAAERAHPLQHPNDREVNCGESSGLRIQKYSPYYDNDTKQLHAGELIKIYEPELKAYLTLMENPERKSSDAKGNEEQSTMLDVFFEVQGAETATKSSYLWVLERHGNTRVGGMVAFESGMLQLRHLNSGRYLCCRTESMWSGSTSKIALVNQFALGIGNPLTRKRGGAAPKKSSFIFSSMGNHGASTAVQLHPPHFVEAQGASKAFAQSKAVHLKLETAASKEIAYIAEGSAVQVESHNNNWLHKGARIGNTEIFRTKALAHQKGNAKLLLQRFSSSANAMADIMVGVSARPILQRYLFVVKKFKQPHELVAEPTFSGFLRVVGQLINFLAGIPLNGVRKEGQVKDDENDSKKIVNYAAIVKHLKLKGASGSEFRQQLLREQGVLDVVLSVVKELLSDRATLTVSDAARRADREQFEKNPNAPPTAGARLKEKLDAIKQRVAHVSCWLMKLAVLDNYESQMMVADNLAILIKCIQLQGIATNIATDVVTHMLGTNLELQETKVQISDIERFIYMVRSSRLSKNGLDLLRSVCSCKGRGIDNNQGHVITALLENAPDLIMKIAPDMGRMPVDAQWRNRVDDKDIVRRIRGGELFKDGLKRILLTWEVGSNAADLAPQAIVPAGSNSSMGPGWVSINTVFDEPRSKQKVIQDYFVSQIYLDAEMCLDRNYCAMQILEEQFPYDLCLSMLMDQDLPKHLKAAVMTLMCSLYVDGDPQTRLLVPQLSRAWDTIDPTKPYSLPRPLEPYTFLLLQDVLAANIEELDQKKLNDEYTLAQMRMLLYLVKFRFYSSSNEISNLVVPLVKSLDCREESLGNASDSEETEKEQRRWELIVYDFLESIQWLVVILLLVLIGIIFMSIQMFGSGIADDDPGVAAFEYTASSIFFLDLVVKIWCYHVKFGETRSFYKDRFSQIDVIVVLIDVILYSVDIYMAGTANDDDEAADDGGGGNAGSLAKSMRAVRLVRLVRVVKAAKIVRVLNEWDDDDEPDWEIPSRYVEAPQLQLQAMLEIIRILNEITLLTRDFLLGNMLVEWKRATNPEFGTRRIVTQVPLRHSTSVTWNAPVGSSGTAADDEQAATIHFKESAAALFARLVKEADDCSLSRASGSVDLIFLDLIMYNDQSLTQAALNLLMVHHSMQENLFRDLRSTQLLVRPNDQKMLARLQEDLMFLQSAAERHELWGELESAEDRKENEKTKGVLRRLAQACYGRNTKPDFTGAFSPCKAIQTMLRNLGGIDTGLTVLGLFPSIDDTDDDAVRENTRELLRLCNVWLAWFICDNIDNQKVAYEHLDFWLDTINDEIDSASVVASIIRGNAELIRQVPISIINRLSEEIIKNGPQASYMLVLEAMVFLDDFEGDNNTIVQGTILKELTRSDRAEKTMLLCRDIHGSEYAERIAWMEESKKALDDLNGHRSDESVTLHHDIRYATSNLSYHCRLLEVLSGCAYGRLNVTTIETKLQATLPCNECLCALLDKKSTMDVQASMAAYVYHVIVDTEIPVAGLGKNMLLWQLFEQIPGKLEAADKLLEKPLAFVACGDGPNAILARQHLMCTWFLIRMVATFFSVPDYWQNHMLKLHDDELSMSPSLPDREGRTFYDRHVEGVAYDAYTGPMMRPTDSYSNLNLPSSPGAGGNDDEALLSQIEEDAERDSKNRSVQEEDYLDSVLSDSGIDFEAVNEDNNLDESSVFSEGTFSDDEELEEGNWIVELLEQLHAGAMDLLTKHQSRLRENEQKVLLDAISVLRTVHRYDEADKKTRLPDLIRDEDDTETIGQQVALQLERYAADLGDDEVLQQHIVEDTTKIITVIENLPSIDDADIEADLRLEPLIKKFVTHVDDSMEVDENKKHLSPETTLSTIWTVRLFRRMIERKWGMTIEERDDDGGEEEDIASEPVVQLLNKHGGTELCIDLIAVGIDQELVLEAVRLCVALLFKEGGNVDVQTTINKRLQNTNSELFFREMRAQIRDMRRFYEFGNPVCEEGEDPEVPDNLIVLRFLQLMSEGHYKPNQDVVREQTLNVVQINLLDDMVKLLDECSLRPSRSSTECGTACADLILEIIQGPCELNQRHFVMDSTLVESINRLLRNQPIGDCDEEADEELKTICLDIFEALLECQVQNAPITDRLLGLVDFEVIKVIVEAPKDVTSGAKGLTDFQVSGLVLLQTFMDFNPALRTSIRLPRRILSRLGKDVQNIEVNWNGTLIRRFFSVPSICTHIADATKDAMVEHVNRDSQDTKLQDFLLRAQDIYREVQHQQNLSETCLGPWSIGEYEIPGTATLQNINMAQVFSRTNQENITWCSFFCALTINFIFLFTMEHKKGWVPGMGPTVNYKEGGFYRTYGQEGVGNFDANGNLLDSKGYVIKPDSAIYYGTHDEVWKTLVMVLNIANMLFSLFTLVLFYVVRCPVKYRKLREEKSKLVAFLLTSTDTMTLYYFFYTIVAFISYRYDSAVHPFLLLDIIVKNSTTADVVKAVVLPAKQLAAAALLGVFVIYIFAMITFKNFASDFRYDGGDDAFGKPEFDDFMPQSGAESLNEDCRTLFGCFKVSLDYGMRLSGGTGDIMTHTLEGNRLITDLLYFLVVLVVLLNVIFGIIIDTFSELRQQKLEKLRDKMGFCFICGIPAQTFEQHSSEPGAFKRHIKEEHFMWSYLNFILFIWEQDKDDDDGLEFYVRQLLGMGDITWFPLSQALCLKGAEKEEESTAEHLDRVRSDFEEAVLADKKRKVAAVSEVNQNIGTMLHDIHRAAVTDYMIKQNAAALGLRSLKQSRMEGNEEEE